MLTEKDLDVLVRAPKLNQTMPKALQNPSRKDKIREISASF